MEEEKGTEKNNVNELKSTPTLLLVLKPTNAMTSATFTFSVYRHSAINGTRRGGEHSPLYELTKPFSR